MSFSEMGDYVIQVMSESCMELPEDVVVFDLETTGFSAAKNEIIEIGAVKVSEDLSSFKTFHSLVKPRRRVPVKITRITGITQRMLNRDGEALDVVLSNFLDFIGDLRLVAFNAPFDMRFLKAAAQNLGVSIDNQVSCALKMARRAWPGRSSYKLSILARDGGLSVKGHHRALKDCELTVQIYAAAVSRLGSVK